MSEASGWLNGIGDLSINLERIGDGSDAHHDQISPVLAKTQGNENMMEIDPFNTVLSFAHV